MRIKSSISDTMAQSAKIEKITEKISDLVKGSVVSVLNETVGPIPPRAGPSGSLRLPGGILALVLVRLGFLTVSCLLCKYTS